MKPKPLITKREGKQNKMGATSGQTRKQQGISTDNIKFFFFCLLYGDFI